MSPEGLESSPPPLAPIAGLPPSAAAGPVTRMNSARGGTHAPAPHHLGELMPHGRDHQQRKHHPPLRPPRQTPENDAFEVKLLSSGRHKGMPPQGLVGPYDKRLERVRPSRYDEDKQ